MPPTITEDLDEVPDFWFTLGPDPNPEFAAIIAVNQQVGKLYTTGAYIFSKPKKEQGHQTLLGSRGI